jgi:hypothetical protein
MHRMKNIGNRIRPRPSLSGSDKRRYGMGCASIIGVISDDILLKSHEFELHPFRARIYVLDDEQFS